MDSTQTLPDTPLISQACPCSDRVHSPPGKATSQSRVMDLGDFANEYRDRPRGASEAVRHQRPKFGESFRERPSQADGLEISGSRAVPLSVHQSGRRVAPGARPTQDRSTPSGPPRESPRTSRPAAAPTRARNERALPLARPRTGSSDTEVHARFQETLRTSRKAKTPPPLRLHQFAGHLNSETRWCRNGRTARPTAR